MRAFWLAVVATLAAGCASTPVPSSNALPVPEHRIFASEYTKAQHGYALLVVTRDQGLIAGACAAHLYVDGTHVADLHNREQVRLFVKTGEHIVGVSAKGCFGGSDQTSVDVTQDKLTLLRIEAELTEGLTIKPSAF